MRKPQLEGLAQEGAAGATQQLRTSDIRLSYEDREKGNDEG